MDSRKKYRRFLMLLLAVSAAALLCMSYQNARAEIPDSYIQAKGEPAPDTESALVTAEIKDDLTEASQNAFATASYTISYKYLGLIPLKETTVEVREAQSLIPGGLPIGIYLETRGVLIIGTGTVTGADGLNYEPAEAAVQGGDYIQAVNGQEIQEKEELIAAVNASGGAPVTLDIERDGEAVQATVQPVQTGAEEYKLGIWVRDNTQGIGTLTFLTEDGDFGALGHGISDADTGELLTLAQGSLYDAEIVSIQRGEAGSPGEISGLIRYRDSLLCGRLTRNTQVGIFGESTQHLQEQLGTEALCVGYKQEIEIGEAWIRSAVSGEMKDYRVEITEIHRNAEDINKGIILEVTDPELLELTGGIVQGMSGSPILQNGKIIGAVTHVFVQDPAKGFGIFIENMLEQMEEA